MKRALLSVYDKTGLVDLARGLVDLGFELVSSGKTAAALAEAGVPVTTVEDVTGAPEMLDGRVKTLHPAFTAGSSPTSGTTVHRADLEAQGIEPIELVVSNLYPFLDRPDIETIDIGGPAMVARRGEEPRLGRRRDEPGAVRRACSASFRRTTARCPTRPAGVSRSRRSRTPPRTTPPSSAGSNATSCCRAISSSRSSAPTTSCATARTRISRRRATAAPAPRAGGTPSPSTAASRSRTSTSTTPTRPGSSRTTSVTRRRAPSSSTPTRAASPSPPTLATAYQRALECDELSAFGGIVALNRPIDGATAERMVAGPQADVVVAPGYEPGTLDALVQKRKNTRLLEAPAPTRDELDFRQITGGFLVQEAPHFAAGRDDWRVVTKVAPTTEQWLDAELAWRVVRAREVERDRAGEGRPGGRHRRRAAEPRRVRPRSRRRRPKAAPGAVRARPTASIPFPDGIEAAAAAGVAVVVQPGGSVRDDENIARADELGLAMVFTGERHFLH